MSPARMLRSAAALAAVMCGLVLGWEGAAGAQERTIRVAAATDLRPVMPALAFGFEKKTGVRVSVVFGSSSTLAEQISNGAPFDVFLGADFVSPESLTAAGLTTAPPVQYAKGTLVLFARKDSPFNPLHMEALTDPRAVKVAVADQFHAPYGRAAYGALDRLKLSAQVGPKLVVAENVAQTAEFVTSGNAQLGLISLTLASSKPMQEVGTYVRVPEIYPEILQYGVVMKKSAHASDGTAFVAWMLSPEVQSHLKEFGLDPVK